MPLSMGDYDVDRRLARANPSQAQGGQTLTESVHCLSSTTREPLVWVTS
jgi:hypothetical protein